MHRLLVVEDEEIVRRGISSLLDFDKLGIGEVFEAENGEQAIEIVDSKIPDIIISDINMPKIRWN